MVLLGCFVIGFDKEAPPGQAAAVEPQSFAMGQKRERE